MDNKKNAIVIGAIVILLTAVSIHHYGTKQFWLDQLDACDKAAGGLANYCIVPISDREINVLTHSPDGYQRFRFRTDNDLSVYAGYYKQATLKLYVEYFKTYGKDEWVRLKRKTTKVSLYYVIEDDRVIIRKQTEYYATKSLFGTGGYLIEEFEINQDTHKYTIKWIPSANRMKYKHRIIMQFSDLKDVNVIHNDFILGSKFVANLKDSSDDINYVELIGDKYVIYFKEKTGSYYIDPSIGTVLSYDDFFVRLDKPGEICQSPVRCESEFTIFNPFDVNLDIGRIIEASFNGDTKYLKSYEYYIYRSYYVDKNIEHRVPVYRTEIKRIYTDKMWDYNFTPAVLRCPDGNWLDYNSTTCYKDINTTYIADWNVYYEQKRVLVETWDKITESTVISPFSTARIRIVGNLKAGLGLRRIEWFSHLDFTKSRKLKLRHLRLLPIKKLKSKRWAWWNSNWQYRQKLTLATSQLSNDVTDDLPILIDVNSENTAFWIHVFTGVDDFEDGDYNGWTVNQGSWSVQSTVVKNGNYALKVTSASSDGDSVYYSTDGSVTTYRTWLRADAVGSGITTILGVQTSAGGWITMVGSRDGYIKYYTDSGYADFSPAISASADTWYEIVIEYSGGSTANAFVYDASGSLLGKAIGYTPNNAGSSVGRIVLYAASCSAYFDDSTIDTGEGKDVRFIASDDTTALTYHFEEFDGTAKKMLAWVKVTDTFTASSDIDIYMYYGNSSATDVQDEAGTYTADFNAVYHMNDASGNITDSTGTYNGTANGTPGYMEAGEIGDCIYFDGDDYFNLGFQLTGESNVTVIAWVKPPNTTNNDAVFGGKVDSTGEGLQLQTPYDGKSWFAVGTSGGMVEDSQSGVTANAWAMIGGIYNGSLVKAFVNDIVSPGSSQSGSIASSYDYLLGARNVDGSANRLFRGYIDEVKVIAKTLSADAIKLLYLSESDQLITFGSEETPTANNPPNLNLNSPHYGYFSGSITIDFNVQDADITSNADGNLFLDIYYSSTQFGFENAVISDGNLFDSSTFTCDDTDFSDSTHCTYTWDISAVADGNYFIDLNVHDDSDANAIDTSDYSIMVDNTPPTTTWDGNTTWQNTDANIHLSCLDATSGCSVTKYRLDTDSSDGISYGSWQTYDMNILVTQDGNWAIDFNSQDVAGNIEATNTYYVLIDKQAPATTDSIKLFDGFEDGDYTSNLAWTLVQGDSADVSVQSSVVKEGSYALRIYNDTSDYRKTLRTNLTLSYKVFSVWVLAENSDAYQEFWIKDSDANIGIAIANEKGDFAWIDYDGSTGLVHTIASGAVASNTWYRLEIAYEPNSTAASFYVYDENDTLLYSATNQSVSSFDPAKLELYVSSSGCVLPNNLYFDSITASASPTGWFSSDVNVYLTCTDSLSGCDTTYYRIDEGSWQTYDSNILFSSDGNFKLDYYSVDVAGNSESTNTTWVAVDKTDPTINNVMPNDGNDAYTSNWIYFDLNDAASGISISTVQPYLDGVLISDFSYDNNCTEYGSYQYHCEFKTHDITEETDYNLFVYVEDKAGNFATHTSIFTRLFNILWGNVNDYYLSDISGIDLWPSELIDYNVEPVGQSDVNGIFNVFNRDDVVLDIYMDLNSNLPNNSIACVDTDNDRAGCKDLNSSSRALVINDLQPDSNQMLWMWFDLNLENIEYPEIYLDYNYYVEIGG